MKALKRVYFKSWKEPAGGGILKVDSFINHQTAPYLMRQIAVEFIRRFASSDITKIIMIEAGASPRP